MIIEISAVWWHVLAIIIATIVTSFFRAIGRPRERRAEVYRDMGHAFAVIVIFATLLTLYAWKTSSS